MAERRLDQFADSTPDPEERRIRRRRVKDLEKKEKAKSEPDQEVRPEEGTQAGRGEPSPETEPPDSEQIRRELAAERVFRERVALAEVADQVSPEAYAAIEQILARTSAEWQLEKGRYLFRYLVGERTLSRPEEPTVVEHRLALRRDQEPADIEKIDTLIEASLVPSESLESQARHLEAVGKALAPEDEVRVRFKSEPDQELLVTQEGVEVVNTDGRATVEETSPPQTEAPESSAPSIAEVRAEATTVNAEEEDVEPEEAPPVPQDLAGVLDSLDREAENLNDLPPIAGAAPEPDQSPVLRAEGEQDTPEDMKTKQSELLEKLLEEQPEEFLELPEFEIPMLPPEPEPDRRRRRRRNFEVLTWELDSPEVVRFPDARMRKKGRKLIRALARLYGIKLTPDLEAYLLEIMLQPRVIGTRKIFGISLNLDHLHRVMQVIKEAYGHEWKRGFW